MGELFYALRSVVAGLDRAASAEQLDSRALDLSRSGAFDVVGGRLCVADRTAFHRIAPAHPGLLQALGLGLGRAAS